VQFQLCLHTEVAARAAADELPGLGRRLTAVRIHDHFRFDPSNSWRTVVARLRTLPAPPAPAGPTPSPWSPLS